MLARRILISLCLLVVACDGDDPTDAGPADAGASDAGAPDAGPPLEFELTTTAFDDEAAVPERFRCGPPAPVPRQGDNVTPDLTWTPGPDGTMSYAIVVRDTSAGAPPGLVHWVMYDIPADTLSLSEGIAPGYMPAAPAGAKQAEIQGSGYFGYFGPCSGGNGNRYVWTVHAIDAATFPGVDMTTTENTLAAMIESASLDSASFTGIW